MFKRMAVVYAGLCMAALSMFLTAKPAIAQEQAVNYYTYVSQWTVPRADWAAFAKQDQAGTAIMKQAVASGLLVAWGTAETRVHTPDGFTHAEWFTATSRENLLKVIEEQWTGATNPTYVTATRHEDLFLRTIAHGRKAGASGTGYLRVSSYQAKPGAADALEGLLTGKVKAFLESEVGKGNVMQYNVDVEEILKDMPGGYDITTLFPDGAAMDRFVADLETMAKSDPTLTQAFASMTVGEDHRDDFFRVSAYQNK